MNEFSDLLANNQRLQSRISHSRDFLDEVRLGFGGLGCAGISEVCVFAAGSLGRFETGRRSDLDLFLIAHNGNSDSTRSVTRLSEIEIFSDLIRLNENLNLPKFSGDGRFLKIHELSDLVDATGDSARDDSENLFTTRLLLLLESRPLLNDDLYKHSIRRVLEHYFRDGKGRKDFKPLFVLNDILRYWRTLCLNYERDRTLDKPWWKKNLNLKFSRKLTVFSTVFALISEQITTVEEFEQFTKLVPLERMAHALDAIGDAGLLEQFSGVLDSYEDFLAAKSYAELENKDPDVIGQLREKAELFAIFLDNVFRSDKLDKKLVRYVIM